MREKKCEELVMVATVWSMRKLENFNPNEAIALYSAHLYENGLQFYRNYYLFFFFHLFLSSYRL